MRNREDDGVDNRKKRLLRSIGGEAYLRVPLEVLRKHALEASPYDLDCAEASLVQVQENGRIFGLTAKKKIKRGQLITLLQPSYVFALTSPSFDVAKIEEAPTPLAKDSPAFTRATTALWFNQFDIGGGLTIVVDQLYVGVIDSIDVKHLSTLNPSYIGNLVNEGPVSVAIQDAVDRFIARCTRRTVDKATNVEAKEIEFSLDEALELAAEYGHCISAAPLNASVQLVPGICLPCIVASQDIPKGSLICGKVGLVPWLGTRMADQNFKSPVIASCLLDLERALTLPENLKRLDDLVLKKRGGPPPAAAASNAGIPQ